MPRLSLSVVTIVAIAIISASAARPPVPAAAGDWPSFRGVRGAGVADGFPLATTWNVPKAERVRWSTAVDGLGHSSPVISGDRLCVTTAISGKTDAGLRPGLYGDVASVVDDTSHTWKLICLSKTTGRVTLDKTILSRVPTIKRHTKSTHANATLAIDGSTIVAMLGSEGLYAFDVSGRELWKRDLGVLDAGWYVDPGAQWEFSSSPVIHDGVVVIQADVQKNSFLGTFDLKTGAPIWRVERKDVPTFGTPTIHQVGATTQILVNGWRHMGAYDFKTGREIWKIDGGGDIPVPTPIVGHGLVFLTNSHGGLSPVYAVRETATGNVSLKSGETSNAHVAWSAQRDGAYLVTPVLYQGLLYVCRTNGAFSVYNATTGERLYQHRVAGGTTAFTSSLVAGDGKVFFTGEDGDVHVVKAGPTFELLATNPLGDIAMATPAISEGVLYFRTAKRVMAIGGR
jgi:outer membrane protein assembly factor BamB